MLKRTRWLTTLSVLVLSCGSDTSETAEQNVDDVQATFCADYPASVACPTLPAPPQLEDGTDFSQWTPSPCPAGTMPDFGRTGCVVVGDPCPEGIWPDVAPADNVRYVTPGGTGDGLTKETASGDVQAMLSGNVSGTTVVVSKGTYAQSFEVARRQEVIGACARETIFTGMEGPDAFPFLLSIAGSGGSLVKNITFRSTGEHVGLLMYNTSEAFVDGIVIDNPFGLGVYLASNAHLNASNVVVQNVRQGEGGSFGRGISMELDSTLELDNALVQNAYDAGIFAALDSKIDLKNVIVRDSKNRSDGYFGRGLNLQQGVEGTVNRLLLLDNQEIGLFVGMGDGDTQTSLTAENVVIRGTKPLNSGLLGRGIEVNYGASLNLRQALVDGNQEVGIFTQSPGTRVTLEDVTVLRTKDSGLRFSGRGFEVNLGAEAVLRRVLLEANGGNGFYARDINTSIVAEDLVIRDPELALGVTRAVGIEISGKATMSLQRGLISGMIGTGVLAGSPETTLSAEDLVIRNTRSGELGRGGRGLQVQIGAVVNVTRGVFDSNREMGVMVVDEGAEVHLESTSVTNTQLAQCVEYASDPCSVMEGGGDGILVMGGGHIGLRDFQLVGNRRVGLHFYDPQGTAAGSHLDDPQGVPSLDASKGEIRGNDYGINFRGDSITPAYFTGKEVACYENTATVDGCYSVMDLDLPSPDGLLQDVSGASQGASK